MERPTLELVRKAMERLGYIVFDGIGHDGVKRNYDLNIFGVRSAVVQANKFDDWLGVFWMNWETGGWEYHVWPATTDPGAFWLHKPQNTNGTAILVEGQYPSSHRIGKHKGYTALVQNSPLRVYRDKDTTDDILHMLPGSIQRGDFGIDIHRASAYTPSTLVDKWSAGCQVIADPGHFDALMDICFHARDAWGPIFTYTLLTESQLQVDAV